MFIDVLKGLFVGRNVYFYFSQIYFRYEYMIGTSNGEVFSQTLGILRKMRKSYIVQKKEIAAY